MYKSSFNIRDIKYILIFSIVLIFFSSCATIFNSRHCNTKITAHEAVDVIIDFDTINFSGENEVKTIRLERSEEKREITIVKDISIDTIVLSPRYSPVYWLNFASFGWGFLIDDNSSKKWQYPKNVPLTNRYIEKNSPNKIYKNGQDNNFVHNKYSHKGVVNLRISIPEVNWFCSAYARQERKMNIGFLGISLGLDYFYKDNMFINVSGSGIMDFMAPVPVSANYGGVWDHMSSLYGSISNNHKMTSGIAVGYGLSFGHDIWDTINHGSWDWESTSEELIESVYRRSQSLGFVFPTYYYAKKCRFYLGMVYRPMFLQFSDKTSFTYQHTVSLDFGLRIRLKKR